MLLFLPHLEAGQVGVFELQAVLLFEILGDCALHSLSVLELQRKSGGTGRRIALIIGCISIHFNSIWIEKEHFAK